MPLTSLLPPALEPAAIRAWILARPALKILLYGRSRYCPLCGSWTRRFLPHGPGARRIDDARCPVCRSVRRHRLSWIFLKQKTSLFDGKPKRLLHVAPEISLMPAFEAVRGLDYLSADLSARHAMLKMDLTAIQFPDRSFDAIYCSHVLEHIPEDRKAMAEMFRVLRPGGWALIMVPVSDQPTFEDPSVTDPAERERLFWQDDHVRLYGYDLRDRLAAAGFEVQIVFGRDLLGAKELETMAIDPGEAVFFARKPAL